MSIIAEIFEYSFLSRAFFVGLLVSLSASLIGVSLVLRRFSMIGDGLSHVGFGALVLSYCSGKHNWQDYQTVRG